MFNLLNGVRALYPRRLYFSWHSRHVSRGAWAPSLGHWEWHRKHLSPQPSLFEKSFNFGFAGSWQVTQVFRDLCSRLFSSLGWHVMQSPAHPEMAEVSIERKISMPTSTKTGNPIPKRLFLSFLNIRCSIRATPAPCIYLYCLANLMAFCQTFFP